MKYLISACLVGLPCRYNGTDSYNKEILTKLNNSELIVVCPELLSGEKIPRPACNISMGDGNNVINGTAKIIGIDNIDYTKSYLDGAKKVLTIAKENKVEKAILKKYSPTCGCGEIYDPTGRYLIPGDGILTALLKNNNIQVIPM